MREKIKPDFESNAPRACLQCKGSGIYVSEGFTGIDGKVWPRTERECVWCKGAREMGPPDYLKLVEACIATRGKNKGKLRASPPTDHLGKAVGSFDKRAYYIWRMARFHGGKDVTFPMMAMDAINGDPWHPELDAMADWVAARTCGTNMAAAARWGAAFGFLTEAPTGLPASAYSGGPVADGNKPDYESEELK